MLCIPVFSFLEFLARILYFTYNFFDFKFFVQIFFHFSRRNVLKKYNFHLLGILSRFFKIQVD